jgi:3-deoxy-D-manno-octulosonic-acid transferase
MRAHCIANAGPSRHAAIVMRWLYSALLYLVAPLLLLRLLWRGFSQREYWARIPERLGFVPRVPEGVAVWVHAVSVGESIAALPLIRRLLEEYPRSVLVTTTTPTGSERVRAALGDLVLHTYAPWDLPDAVYRFVRRVRPRRVIVMETELWPNLFRALATRHVPIVIANARLSPRSFAGYKRIRSLVVETLSHCSAIAAQSEADAQRFRDLGAPRARVHMLGNLKFDLETPEELIVAGRVLRARWGAARPVWIAASTHEGEEDAALRAHRILLKRFPQAVLVLVPRHPQRFAEVARLCEKSGLVTMRRSALVLPSPFLPSSDRKPRGPAATAAAEAATAAGFQTMQVLLGDSMGELPMYYGASDVAFVGGSLVEVGGHNVLEPASIGVPVIFGPYMFNFETARALLLERHAARQIDDMLALEPALTALLQEPGKRKAMGIAGRVVLQSNRGALRRLIGLIENS